MKRHLAPVSLLLAVAATGLSAATSTPEFKPSKVHTFARSDTVLAGAWTGMERVDLLVIHRSSEDFAQGAIHLLKNLGEGRWSEPVRLLSNLGGFAPSGGIVTDLNGNGLSDLITDNTVVGQLALRVFLNSEEDPGTLTLVQSLPFGFSVAAGDLNGNGYPDLVFLQSEVQTDPDALLGHLQVAINRGLANGVWQGFEEPVTYDTTLNPGPENPRISRGLAIGDFTGNGWMDVAADTLVLVNEGSGTLRPVMLDGELAEVSLLLHDLNGDGRAELVQGRLAPGNALSPRQAELGFYRWSEISEQWEDARAPLVLGMVTAFDIGLAAGDVSGNLRQDLVATAGSHLFFLTGDRGGEDFDFSVMELTRHYLTDSESPLIVAYSGQPFIEDFDGDGTPDFVAPRGGTQILPTDLLDFFYTTRAPVRMEVFSYLSPNGTILDGPEARMAGVSGLGFEIAGGSLSIRDRTSFADLDGDGKIEAAKGEVGVAVLEGLASGDYTISVVELDASLRIAGLDKDNSWNRTALPGDLVRLEFPLAPVSDAGWIYQGGIVDAELASPRLTGPLHLPDPTLPLRLGEDVVFEDGSFWKEHYEAHPDDMARAGRDGIRIPQPWAAGGINRLTVWHKGGEGYLNLWLASLGDEWESGSWVVVNLPADESGRTELVFAEDSLDYPIAFRLRLSPAPLWGPMAPSVGGETEDYLLRGFNFGSATPPYPAGSGEDGAIHALVEDLHLGRAAPPPAFTWPGADNTHPRPLRGVLVLDDLQPGAVARLQVTARGTGYLQTWMDFGAKGHWDGPGDTVVRNFAINEALPEEPRIVQFNVPSDAIPGLAFARARLSTELDLGPTGAARDGSVEDFMVQVLSPSPGPLQQLLKGDDLLGEGWLRSRWFGIFKRLEGGWIFHGNLGLGFVAEAGAAGIFIYIEGLGWTFTGDGVFPYLYVYNEEVFAYMHDARTFPDRWFYFFSSDDPGWRNVKQE